jgi:NitT/TauT family transport system permease protein
MTAAAASARSAGIRIGSIVALLAVWWAAAQLMKDPEVLPGPYVIGRTIVTDLTTPGLEDKSGWFHIGITLARIFVTFAAAMLAGIGIGLTMGLNRLFERSMMALIPLTLTMPTILMVFLAVMWFGYSEAGALVAVMLVVTPYVAVNIFEGAKAMDSSLAEMAVTFKAHQGLTVRKVYLPQLMPYIFSAFRYAFGMTWKIVALAETFGLKYGIGYMFFFWFQQFEMPQVLAWIVMFVILMLILEHGVFAQLERRAFAWRRPLAH